MLKEINEAKKKQREEGKAKNSVDDDNGDDDNDDDDRNEDGNDDDGKGKEKEGDGGKEGGSSSEQKVLLNYVFDSAPSISLLSHEEEDRLLALASISSQTKEDKLVAADSSKSTCEINNNSTNVKNEDSVDKSNNDDKDDDKGNDEGKEENNNNETSTTKETAEDTSDINIPIEKVRWMYEVVEEGWIMYSNEVSRELEQASRDNKVSHTITIGDDVHTVKLDNRRYTRSNADGEFKIRRHILGDGLSGLWEVLTMKYEKPSGLYGIGILKILEKVWSKKETMSGQQCGLGFIFLYNLYTGESRCKVSGGGGMNDFKGGIGPQMNPFFMFGGKKLGSGSSSSNDSHRFALLLTQLYTDKHMKSLPASVLNILGKKKYYIINVYVYFYIFT